MTSHNYRHFLLIILLNYISTHITSSPMEVLSYIWAHKQIYMHNDAAAFNVLPALIISMRYPSQVRALQCGLRQDGHPALVDWWASVAYACPANNQR